MEDVILVSDRPWTWMWTLCNTSAQKGSISLTWWKGVQCQVGLLSSQVYYYARLWNSVELRHRILRWRGGVKYNCKHKDWWSGTTKLREQAVQPQFSWWMSQKLEKCLTESNCPNVGAIFKVKQAIPRSRVFTALVKSWALEMLFILKRLIEKQKLLLTKQEYFHKERLPKPWKPPGLCTITKISSNHGKEETCHTCDTKAWQGSTVVTEVF